MANKTAHYIKPFRKYGVYLTDIKLNTTVPYTLKCVGDFYIGSVKFYCWYYGPLSYATMADAFLGALVEPTHASLSGSRVGCFNVSR